MCAIVLRVLAPMATHALATDRALPWMEVCTTEGLKPGPADTTGTRDQPAQPHSGGATHCPYCAGNPVSFGAPTHRSEVAPAKDRRIKGALRDGHCRAAAYSLAARPRAPPLS
ncbi:MAG TPA: DUF2946 family protein [Burkholderiaceae bacterium]|nr:DUF2946 family protein [Burkholderiaceae bacterium]